VDDEAITDGFKEEMKSCGEDVWEILLARSGVSQLK
jgi:hypothetical protein